MTKHAGYSVFLSMKVCAEGKLAHSNISYILLCPVQKERIIFQIGKKPSRCTVMLALAKNKHKNTN